MSRYDVKITENPDEAEYFAGNSIPYIVYLNDNNKDKKFPNGAYCVENLEDIDDEYRKLVYFRTKGEPLIVMETDRLIIREIKVEDVDRLYKLYADESITKYMEPLFEDIDKEIQYTRDYIENIYGFYGYGMWIIILKETSEIIGRAGVEYKEGFDGLELGFMLGVEYQHKGYAYEACSAILEYSKDNLQQRNIRAVVHMDNVPSRKLCEKLGLKISDNIPEVGFVEYKC